MHMCTAAALLELDFTQPSLDYHSLMKLTKIITRDSPEDIENMYRRMCFNFTYLYDENKEKWCLSPAYDLTYSSTYYGEHTTTVDENGSDPGMKELIKVGTKGGMSRNKCRELAEEIQECVNQMLGKYRI